MEETQKRRQFLSVAVAGTAVGIAGCSSDSGGDDGGTNNSSNDGDSDESADGDSETTDDSDASSSGEGGVSLDLDLVVDQLPDAFESLTIEFTGFSFFSMTGSTLVRDSDPVQADLAELAASGASIDLMETTVPADEYDSSRYFIAVTDTTMSSDDSEQTFRSEEDGEVIAGLHDESESFDVTSGESITLTAQVSVQDAFDYDWKFDIGFSKDRES